jgi:hypothetical protein
MVARVSLDDIIIYASGALAEYLGASKKDLVGSSLEQVGQLCGGEVSSCFARPPARDFWRKLDGGAYNQVQ